MPPKIDPITALSQIKPKFETPAREGKLTARSFDYLIAYMDLLEDHDAVQKFWQSDLKSLVPIIAKKQPQFAKKITTTRDAKTHGVTQIGVQDSTGAYNVYPASSSVVDGDDLKESPAGKAVSGAVDAVSSVSDFLGALASALFSVKFWIRVLEALIALTLIGIGLSKLASDTPVGKAATRAISPLKTRKVK